MIAAFVEQALQWDAARKLSRDLPCGAIRCGMPIPALDAPAVPDSWLPEEFPQDLGGLVPGSCIAADDINAQDAASGIIAAMDNRLAELANRITGQYERLSRQVAAQTETVAGLAEGLRLKDRRSLTLPEAARHAGKEPATIRRWLAAGKLRGTKDGDRKQSRWRIAVRDLDRFLERMNNSLE